MSDNQIKKNETLIVARSLPMNAHWFKKMCDKFPAFQAALPTVYAMSQIKRVQTKNGEIDQRIWINSAPGFGTCWSHMRGKVIQGMMPFNSARTGLGYHDPNMPHGDIEAAHDATVRPSLYLRYDANSSVVSSCTDRYRISNIRRNEDASIFLKDDAPIIEVRSCAAVVLFGENPYIWLNKEECESGIDTEMQLISEFGLEMAEPFDHVHFSTDLANATELLAQYEGAALGSCNEEELNLVVPVVLSSIDDYEKAYSHAEVIKDIKATKLEITKKPQ